MANLRDVGGLPLTGGGRVRPGVLYRGDAPFAGDLAPSGLAWPPRTVIDLRDPGELDEPNPLADGARHLQIPLFPGANPMVAHKSQEDFIGTYHRVLDEAGPSIARLAAAIAAEPAPVLVHCTAGKDRTGVSMGVILAAVGVEPEAIVADYRRTEENVAAIVARMARSWPDGLDGLDVVELFTVRRPDLMATPAAAMHALLAVLDGHPEGPSGWLVSRGLSPADLELLRERLRG